MLSVLWPSFFVREAERIPLPKASPPAARTYRSGLLAGTLRCRRTSKPSRSGRRTSRTARSAGPSGESTPRSCRCPSPGGSSRCRTTRSVRLLRRNDGFHSENSSANDGEFPPDCTDPNGYIDDAVRGRPGRPCWTERRRDVENRGIRYPLRSNPWLRNWETFSSFTLKLINKCIKDRRATAITVEN